MPGITLHPDPSGDDWAQITAAFNTIRANGRGWVEFDQPTSAEFNIKQCVNGTNMPNADIRFAPGSAVRCDGFVGPSPGVTAPMFDFSNSWWFGVTGMGNFAGLISGIDGRSPAGTVMPNCAILLAGGDTKRIRNITPSGSFCSASFAVINSSDIEIDGGTINNYHNTAPSLTISSRPDWGVSSPYTKFVATPDPLHPEYVPIGNCNDIKISTRIHQFSSAPFALYLRDVQHCKFDGLLLNGGSVNRAIAQGHNSNISFFGGAAGVEIDPSTHNATSVMGCTSPDSCTNLRFYNFNPSGIPYKDGSGNFTGYSAT